MTHVTAPSIDWFCIFNDSRWFIILLLYLTAFRNLTLVAKLPTFMFLLCFFIFVSCFLYMLSYFPAFFLVLLSKPQNTSLVLISLNWFCIFNYTLFSSDCFTMQPRWNHDKTMMTYTEDMTHVTTPWLDRFCIFNAPAFTVITFLTNTKFLLWFLFSLTVSTIPFLMSVTFFSSYSF